MDSTTCKPTPALISEISVLADEGKRDKASVNTVNGSSNKKTLCRGFLKLLIRTMILILSATRDEAFPRVRSTPLG